MILSNSNKCSPVQVYNFLIFLSNLLSASTLSGVKDGSYVMDTAFLYFLTSLLSITYSHKDIYANDVKD